ncbi:Ankyrin-2 isoform 3 [Schistosoma japonicum]|uniref:Ankyrin-2 isoform 3 n=2 Tax=Schistosoma japonicum TaxID=6182 RepID=A0A4Z2DR61_SCHJA|nr:Ankyrin-2 isoform 3 [Schistosoma japonicum]
MRYISKQEQFWIACSFGREEAAKKLIEVGVDVNWRSYVYECYPIHVCSQGKPSILQMVIQAGADINALDSGGNTALHHAAMSGNEINAQMLLSAGVTVDIVNKNGWTPLFNAVYWNHPSISEMLLASGSSPFLKNKNGRIPLHELCRTKSKDSVRILKNFELLLQCMNKCKREEAVNSTTPEYKLTNENDGLNLNKTTLSNCEKSIDLDNMSLRACTQNDLDSEADFTPLLFACYHGHLELVKALLDRGVNVSVTDKNHWTALHWAAQQCHADIVEVLLDYGASIYAKDLRGCMPYSVTSDIGLQECLSPDTEYPNIISNGHVTTDDEEDDSDDDEKKATVLKSNRQVLSQSYPISRNDSLNSSVLSKQLGLLELSLIENQMEISTAEIASPEVYINTV